MIDGATYSTRANCLFSSALRSDPGTGRAAAAAAVNAFLLASVSRCLPVIRGVFFALVAFAVVAVREAPGRAARLAGFRLMKRLDVCSGRGDR